MANIKKLSPGNVLYTVTKQYMGNTRIKTVAVHLATILEVHERHVIASWNGNPPRRYAEYEIKHWRTEKPILVSAGIGFSKRLATRAEISAMKSQHNAHLTEEATVCAPH